jgi:hypothetical protein
MYKSRTSLGTFWSQKKNKMIRKHYGSAQRPSDFFLKSKKRKKLVFAMTAEVEFIFYQTL